jgi:hypothetical protein
MVTPAQAEARWRDHPLDAVALVRASIALDPEAAKVVAKYADQDRVIDWLTTFARCWLLDLCGLRSHRPIDDVVARALDYLGEITASWTEGEAAA